MTWQRYPHPAWRVPRWAAGPLTVFALLAGLVAMHGIGPWPAVPAAPTHQSEMAAADGMSVTAERLCHGSGGHPEHADPACAAAAVGGAPGPQAPELSPLAVADATRAGVPGPGPAHDLGGRAPPSLNQLQLLRI
ncbi:hypothetical protein E1265_14055 [Streptomyces sp. 8K308]|uniref:DUF6153 family protein n=1 Tax=Streptomyces sp. 8K308 TaxID=2530388 RepID=UPI001045B765|nr:DUF6153 family protein [Streptomyces sp. 8K308]TDC23025.1 hypothetical protein E1265_14055 [Streptomyces sp. 8K308]